MWLLLVIFKIKKKRKAIIRCDLSPTSDKDNILIEYLDE